MKAMKRTRSSNWNEQEKKVLRMLVRERADIIESKDTSTNTNSAKKLAWEEVLLRFNAINASNRDITQLHNQWRNMKNKAKKTEPNGSPPAEHFEYIDPIPHGYAVDTNENNSDTIYSEQPETSHSQPQRPSGPSFSPINKKQRKKSDCCSESHEHQLFVLAKTAREEAMLREEEAHECKMRYERELHDRRMAITCLEEEYWRSKIMNLK